MRGVLGRSSKLSWSMINSMTCGGSGRVPTLAYSSIQCNLAGALQKHPLRSRGAGQPHRLVTPQMSVRLFSSTLAQQTEEVTQPREGYISTHWEISRRVDDDGIRKKVSRGVHGAGDLQERNCSDDTEQLKKRREEILSGLPSYVPFLSLGHHRILVYPVLHGNANAVHAAERGKHVSSGAAGKEGGCGTSYEAAQLIRLLAPRTVFLSAEPPEKRNLPCTLAAGPSSSYDGGDGGLSLEHGKFRYPHLHSASVGYLQSIHGGKPV